MNVTLDIDNDDLLCLRMGLVNRLNWIETYQFSGRGDAFLAKEKVRTNKLLAALPEKIDTLDGDVRELLAQEQYIQAVKLYRNRTGATLKDAKDAVDRLKEAV